MFDKDSILSGVKSYAEVVGNKVSEAASIAGEGISAVKDRVVGGEKDVSPIVTKLLVAVAETKPEFLERRFTEILKESI